MAGPTRVLKQGPGVDALPPPGDERREVLAERTDDLAEAAEAASEDRGRIREDAFMVENELAQHFNELDLPGWPWDTWVPCWVQCSPTWGGRFINYKRTEGWEVVSTGMTDVPIPKDLIFPDGTVRLGDVLLMRIRRDRYIVNERRRRARQKAIESGITSEVDEMAARAGTRSVHTEDITGEKLDQLARRSQAHHRATQQFDEMVRTGTVPGRPAPR